MSDKDQIKRALNNKFSNATLLEYDVEKQIVFIKNMDEYDNYDSDMNYSSNDDYDDYDNEDNDTDRLIDKVSNTLGYRVDEGLARAFIHDMSKL